MTAWIPRFWAWAAMATSAFVTTHAVAQRPMLEPALRDPFAVPAPAAALLPAPPPRPHPTAAPAPPVFAPAPAAPTLPDLQFAGRFDAPDGAHHVWARVSGQVLRVVPGASLPQGWRVQAVTASAVELAHPLAQQPARVLLPTAPSFERH